jgi:ABC-2 type transport system permease protein
MYMFALFRQQLRQKRLTLLGWCIVWSLLILLFATVFNSLSKDATESAKVFEQLPKGVYNAFNIDPAMYLSRIESFISGQFLSVYMLAGSIFSFSLGIGAISRRIDNGTIAGILTKPISRGKIYLAQLSVNTVFLLLAGSIVGMFAWTAFNLLLQHQDSISGAYFFWAFTGSTAVFIVFAAFGQLLGMVLNAGRPMAVGAAIVVASWFINSLSDVVHFPGAITAMSIFHYFDVATLRDTFTLNTRAIWLVLLFVLFSVAGWRIFKKKDIYV